MLSEGCRQREGRVGYNLLSAFPFNFLIPNCPVHPLSLASGALRGDHLRAWAV